ncbi:MAG: HlyD family efflux transporter periplasmic adaptor subunit [Chitinophagales bacterium]
MQKRQIIITAVAIAILVVGFFANKYLSSLKKDPPKRSLPEMQQYAKVTKVSYSTQASTIPGNGRIQAGKRVILSPEVQGLLMEGDVNLKEGASFRKGQLLFKIDDTEARLQLKAEKSNFLTALAGILPDIKIDYPDDYPKWKSYFDDIDIDKKIAEMPSFKDSKLKTLLSVKNILSLYYNIKSAEVRIEKYSFFAPFSGSFSRVMLEAGTIVNPGVQIAEIIESADLEIEMPLATDEIQWVEIGTKGKIIDSKGKQYPATVKRMASFLDASTQSVNVYLQFKNPGHFYEGMYVDVLLQGPEIDSVFEIPRAAIFNKNQIYVLKDSLLQPKTAEIIKANEKTALIRGPEKGAWVVSEALMNPGKENKYLPKKENSPQQE